MHAVTSIDTTVASDRNIHVDGHANFRDPCCILHGGSDYFAQAGASEDDALPAWYLSGASSALPEGEKAPPISAVPSGG
jgi:hypothetical protein